MPHQLCDDHLTEVEHAVFALLCVTAGPTGIARVTRDQVGEALDLPWREVRDALDALEEVGAIEVAATNGRMTVAKETRCEHFVSVLDVTNWFVVTASARTPARVEVRLSVSSLPPPPSLRTPLSRRVVGRKSSVGRQLRGSPKPYGFEVNENQRSPVQGLPGGDPPDGVYIERLGRQRWSPSQQAHRLVAFFSEAMREAWGDRRGPLPVNEGALRRAFRRWLDEGLDAKDIEVMIEVFLEQKRLPNATPWKAFLAQRTELHRRATARLGSPADPEEAWVASADSVEARRPSYDELLAGWGLDSEDDE